MVALGEKLCRNDTRPQCCRRRKDRFGRYGKSPAVPAVPAVSESSVISVAGNYPNGGPTGNILNGTTDSLWQGWQTIEERNPFGGSGSTDTPVKQYIWGTYIDECVQINLLSVAGPQSLPVGVYYLLQDLLYRAVALTNSSGSIVEAYDTDAYGNTLIFTGPGADGIWFTDDDVQSNYGANSIIYCGYRYDPEAQLYYVRNRYYSPVLGRWITRDPIGYAGGINLYGYAAGDSAAFADMLGTSVISPGYPGPVTLPPGGAAAAQALAAAIEALADLAWLPWAAAALAALVFAYAVWRAACVELYDTYKAECAQAALLGGCRAKRPCSEYPPKIAAWLSCASGRQNYLDAGCDIIIPTRANHLAAAEQARAAYTNCLRLQPTCVPDCPVP